MQSLTDGKREGTRLKYRLRLFIPLSVAVLAVSATLVGIFTLSNWAEASAAHHAIQHVVIFLSGVGFGGSIVTGYLGSRGGTNNES